MSLVMSLQNSYTEAGTPVPQNVTVSERRPLKRQSMKPLGRDLIQYDWCSYQKSKLNPQRYQECTPRGTALRRHREKMAACKPRTEVSGETSPADILILDPWPSELWEMHSCCLSHPACSVLWWQPQRTHAPFGHTESLVLGQKSMCATS